MAPTPPLLPIIPDGRHCVGHLLRRGPQWELFDAADQSLGLHASPAAAITALVAAASKQPEPAS